MNDAHSDVLMSLSDESLRQFEAGAEPGNAGGTWLTVAQAAQRLNVSHARCSAAAMPGSS